MGRRAPARGQKSGEGLGRDVWVPRRAGGGRGPALSGGRRCAGGQRKQEGREEEEEAGLLCKFQKDQGSHCKTKMSPKLGLK